MKKMDVTKKNQAKISNFWPIDLIGLEKISVDLIFYQFFSRKAEEICTSYVLVRPNLTQIDFKWVAVRTIATYYSTIAILPTFQIQKFYLFYYLSRIFQSLSFPISEILYIKALLSLADPV